MNPDLSCLRGWILDLYPSPEGMVLWLIDETGQAHRMVEPFPMALYVGGASRALAALEHTLGARYPRLRLARARRYDLFLDREIEVLEATAPNPIAYRALFRELDEEHPHLAFYNVDLNPALVYGLERGVFPLAYCTAQAAEGRLRSLVAEDSPWSLDYALPPLRMLSLRLGGDLRDPGHGYRGVLEIGTPHTTYRCRWENPRVLLTTLRAAMYAIDPDILLTAWGDSFILPEIFRLSEREGIPLPWNRDPAIPPARKRGRSYFSYGQIVYRAPSISLFGRLHIDRQTAFLSDEYGLDGMYELARITGQPLQQVARTSTGTGISAMQVATAYREGWLIPYRKREPESFKTALELIRSDKGGLTFQPEPGLYEDVLELDFASLYPSLMVKFNLSPETVKKKCPRCRPQLVPEIGYPVCRCKTGLVPLTLEPVVARRLALKRLAKGLIEQASGGLIDQASGGISEARSREPDDEQEVAARPDERKRELYRRRQLALKWLLVTCFGYLGYKNARFGRIEAHEATTAYGREMLLRAKEIAEARGYTFLHGLTDSLWVHKRGATQAEHQALADAISQACGVLIGLEGVYRWVAFLPSRVRAELSVANRYFGLVESGEMKLRGIEVRRHDTILWVRQAQQAMLAILAEAHSAREYRLRLEDVFALARTLLARLRSGKVPAAQLLITNRLSRKPGDYRSRQAVALAARELEARGVALAPGESIEYILTAGGGARPFQAWSVEDRYDVARYEELFVRMLETLAVPAGLGRKEILERLTGIGQPELFGREAAKGPMVALVGAGRGVPLPSLPACDDPILDNPQLGPAPRLLRPEEPGSPRNPAGAGNDSCPCRGTRGVPLRDCSPRSNRILGLLSRLEPPFAQERE